MPGLVLVKTAFILVPETTFGLNKVHDKACPHNRGYRHARFRYQDSALMRTCLRMDKTPGAGQDCLYTTGEGRQEGAIKV